MKPAARRISQSLVALYSLTGLLGFAKVVQAQVTPDNTGGSGTTVNQEGNKFQIEDGVEAGDNLIHSFDQFSLGSDQSAIFNIDANIQNILSRVTGGNLSQINGLIEVLGGTGSTNLFLMNPAGIVFGQGASLDVPGSFTATTATSIGLGNDQWFNATGPIDASKLAGNPNNSFAFNTSEPGGIVSSANLTVDSGNLTLIGGTVVSEGTLSAPQGQVNIATVPGDTVVRLSQPGMVLNLEFEPVDSVSGNPGNWDGNVASLPQLLTGGGIDHATQAIADADGQQVILSGSGITVNNGDVVATGKITGQDGIGISAFNITTGELDTSAQGNNLAGDISLLARRNIEIGDIRTEDRGGPNDDSVSVQISSLEGDITTKNIFGNNSGNGNASTFTLEAPQGDIYIDGAIRLRNNGNGEDGQLNWFAQSFQQKPGEVTDPSSDVVRELDNTSISNPLNSVTFPPFTEFNSDSDNSDSGNSDSDNSDSDNSDSDNSDSDNSDSDNSDSDNSDSDNSDSDNSNTANDDSSDGENSNTEDSSDSNSDIANQDGDGVDMGDIGNDLNNNDVTNSEDEEFTDPVDVDDIDDSILDTEDSSGNTDTSDSGDSQTADSSGNTDTSDSGDSQTADSSGNTDTSDSGDSQTADSSGNTDTSDSGDSQTADSSVETDTSDSTSSDNSGAIADNGDDDTQAANSDTENSSQTYSRTYSRVPSNNTNNDDEDEEENCSADDPSCEEGNVAESNAESNNSNSGNNNSASTTYSRTPTQPSSDAIATTENTTANPANTDNANSNTQSDSSSEPTNTNGGNSEVANNSANTNNQTYSRVPTSTSNNPTTPSTDSGNNNSANDNAVNTPNTDTPSDTPSTENANTDTSNDDGDETYSRNPVTADNSGTETVDNNTDNTDPTETENANTDTSNDDGDETYSRNPVTPDNSDTAQDNSDTETVDNNTDNTDPTETENANTDTSNDGDDTYSRNPVTPDNSDTAQDNSDTETVDNNTDNTDPTETENANTDTSNDGDETYSRNPDTTENSETPEDNSDTETVDNNTDNTDPTETENANTDTSNDGDDTYSRNPVTPDNSDTVNNGGSNPTDSGDNSGIANGNSNTSESSGQDTTAANNGNGTPSETSQQQASSQEESSIPSETDNVSDRVDQLEAAFTQEFQTYLQQQFVTKRLNLQDITERTRDIEQVTGLKTAVIYVSFVPQPMNSEANACQTESAPSVDRRFGYTPSASSNCSPEDNQQLELVLITANGEAIQRRVPNAIRAKVLAETQKFQRTLSDRRNLGSTNYLDSAQQLYQWLIEPLAEDLEARQIQGLMFAMDSGLRSLPIAALHDGDNFLIENYSVNLIPSFSLMQARNPDIRLRPVLAMGASKFLDLQELPYVPLELSTITEYLWKGKAFLNEKFTFQNLQEQISQNEFGIIHLATHAEFKPGNPENSYIQMWNRKLRLNELKELGLSNSAIDLLVLSACRTALGNQEAELGFAGSALQAGVDSTLATLWYVSDEGALGVTTEFYRQLRQVPIKSEALRRAQLAMIRGEVSIANGQLNYGDKSITLPPEMAELAKTKNLNFSHPYYWAPFTLIGNPQ